jgi:hypothetical protein
MEEAETLLTTIKNAIASKNLILFWIDTKINSKTV